MDPALIKNVKEDKMLMDTIKKNPSLRKMSVHELKLLRAKMVETGAYSKYETAAVQFWIMHKEGRTPGLVKE